MSWELDVIPEDGKRAEISVTSFSGGPDGRCLQLTQQTDDAWDENHAIQFVQLTEEQMETLVERFQDWKAGKVSEHNPSGDGTWREA